MRRSVFDQHLEWFKENEKPETVLIIAMDRDLVPLVIAWSNTKVHRSGRLSRPNAAAEDARWKWLWTNTRFSREDLLTKSGCSERALEKAMGRLIGNRVIYPDGTVNSLVRKYLRGKVLKLFDPLLPKRSRLDHGVAEPRTPG